MLQIRDLTEDYLYITLRKRQKDAQTKDTKNYRKQTSVMVLFNVLNTCTSLINDSIYIYDSDVDSASKCT